MKKKNTEITPNGHRVALKDKEQRHQMDSTGSKSPTTPMHFTLSCPDKFFLQNFTKLLRSPIQRDSPILSPMAQ